jgi:hypothetical protein
LKQIVVYISSLKTFFVFQYKIFIKATINTDAIPSINNPKLYSGILGLHPKRKASESLFR